MYKVLMFFSTLFLSGIVGAADPLYVVKDGKVDAATEKGLKSGGLLLVKGVMGIISRD